MKIYTWYTDFFRKIYLILQVGNNFFSGVNVLLNFDTSACLQSNENLIPELTFRDFIKKYALNLNYEYQLQYLALQCLHRMTKSINSRIQLICSLNYEVVSIFRFRIILRVAKVIVVLITVFNVCRNIYPKFILAIPVLIAKLFWTNVVS